MLVADRSMRLGFNALLSRHRELGVRPFSFEVFEHSQRDPGVYHNCHEFLRPMLRDYNKALVVFDWEGSGVEKYTPEELESRVEDRLSRNGWKDRCAALVLYPELEAWVWAESAVLANLLGMRRTELRKWLASRGKPKDPKTTLENLLKKAGRPYTSEFIRDLGLDGSFHTCRDRAFRKFLRVLRTWFPTTAN